MDSHSYSDRQKVKRIIEDLRRDHGTDKLAELLGMSRQYIYYAQNNSIGGARGKDHMRKFMLPVWAVGKILEHGKLLGMRRITNQ